MRTSSLLLLSVPALLLGGCAAGSEITSPFGDSKSFGATVDGGVGPGVTVGRAKTITNERGATPADLPAEAPATKQWTVGGTVTGLTGAGLVLQQSGKGDLAIAADGTFTFDAKLATLDAFDVTVAISPSAPAQSCTVSGGSGTVLQGDVKSIAVVCATDAFALGGHIEGLAGAGVVLTSGGVDVTVAANGTWAFPAPLASGSAYAVTVKTQPEDASCFVGPATGTVGGVPVTSIDVTCAAFANASFEQGFTGWTLETTASSPDYGGFTTVASGTTLHLGDSVHDAYSDAEIVLAYEDTFVLPATFTAASPASGATLGLLFSANGSSITVAKRDLALAAQVKTLSFEVQYISDSPLVEGVQHVRVDLHDAVTGELLQNLYLAGTGADATGAATVTADIAAHAGHTVTLQLTSFGYQGPLYTTFDAFRLN